MRTERGEPGNPPAASRVCGIVVSFRPSEVDFERTLRAALPQVDGLVVVDNSPEPAAQAQVVRLVERVAPAAGGPTPMVLTVGENSGLSCGLNSGIRRAVEAGFSLFLLLDQDSVLAPGAVTTLKEEYARRGRKDRLFLLAAQNEVPNPTPLGRLLDSFFHRYRSTDGDSHPSPTAITSGLLVDERVLGRAGLFDESLFLDSADTEFSLRVRRFGTRIYVVPRARVHHVLGEVEGHRSTVLGNPLRYRNESRLYYGTRDSLRTASRYSTTHPVLSAGLVAVALARLGAYRLAGPEYRGVYLAARRGWVHFLTMPDRPRVPPFSPG